MADLYLGFDPLASSLFPNAGDCEDGWLLPTTLDSTLPSFESLLPPRQDINFTGGKPTDTDVLEWFGQADDAPTLDFTHCLDLPANYHSPTPSVCDDIDNLSTSSRSEISTPITEAMELLKKAPPKRKRGRPRLDRSNSGSSDSSNSDSAKPRRSRICKRQPHNEVERKYREGINAELERLRMAVPTLPRCDPQVHDPPRPSKAVVLASAIDYIHKMEVERDRLLGENKMLKSSRRLMAFNY